MIRKCKECNGMPLFRLQREGRTFTAVAECEYSIIQGRRHSTPYHWDEGRTFGAAITAAIRSWNQNNR